MNAHASIADHQKYNAEMAKSLPEKLFFLDRVKADVWVDFGCGDGSVLKVIPEGARIGVERDAEQRELCERGHLHSIFEEFPAHLIREWLQGVPSVTAAIFSSVLHESPELLRQAIAFGFDYIVFRDMALLDQWRDQERDLNAAFKYPYWGTPSWDREVGEDYFQLDAEGILRAGEGYRTIYFEHASVPAIQDRIERDIGVRPDAPTHIKAIWKRVPSTSNTKVTA